MNADQIIKQVDALMADRATLDSVLQDIKRYILPNKDHITSKQGPGQQHYATGRFDSTAIHANQQLAASMQGTLTPSTSPWFQLALREDELMEDKAVRDWLENCGKRMHKAFNNSNFGTVFHQAYLDLGGFGTTAVMQLEKQRNQYGEFTGLNFDTFPISEYCFLEGEDGQTRGFFRVFELRADQALEKFGKMPGYKGLPEEVMEALAADKPEKRNQKFKFVHSIMPRDLYAPEKINAENMPIESRYICHKTKSDVVVSGFMEMPVSVARWEKLTQDNGWGRGPGWTALPETKTLNRIRELGLKGLAKDVAPPLNVPHKGVIGGIRTTPNAINYYDARKTGGAKPEYMQSGSRWDVKQFEQTEIKQAIRQIFYADQLQLQEGPQMTATEVQVRYEMMQRLLGPTFWRLVSELFNPTIYRAFQIMLRAGAFQDPPDILIERSNRQQEPTLDVQYVGPLARAQRQQDVVAIQRAFELGAGIAAATGDQSVFDNFDLDEAMKIGGEQIGVPGKMIRDKDQIQQMREARAQQQAQAQQLAMQQAQEDARLTAAQANEREQAVAG